ncbi:glycosyltransferase family 2 protein [Niabella aurantiaca]|uniref:glycosyltransferase family 2 protein n=1 Tax=Niabella aurantiaca TaxID=379900 RepID=UPI0008FBFC9F|nr:glycosyltransferase family 2 protein [Niabella aurantiaca]
MTNPWVSFCISTYKRPGFLKDQLCSLLTQTDPAFEIVISDNDPEGSARAVVERLNDPRLKYYKNVENLGMVRSFNKSIERATTAFIVMVTDDDPVQPEMLAFFKNRIDKMPGYGIYCGCIRNHKQEGQVESFSADDFLFELLHPQRTPNFLWSSCVLDRQVALDIGGMQDYGSPHLADHAMLALCSKKTGGIMINKMFSRLNKHDDNFSKTNLGLYYTACASFVKLIQESFPRSSYIKNRENVITAHLREWFIVNMFVLKKYFVTHPDPEKLRAVDRLARDILAIPVMKKFKRPYFLKQTIFTLKKPLLKSGILK